MHRGCPHFSAPSGGKELGGNASTIADARAAAKLPLLVTAALVLVAVAVLAVVAALLMLLAGGGAVPPLPLLPPPLLDSGRHCQLNSLWRWHAWSAGHLW